MAKSTPEAKKSSVTGKKVIIGDYNGNATLSVSYEYQDRLDRYPTQVGARKIYDILDNLDDALKVLEASKWDEHKELAKRYRSKMPSKKSK